VREKKEGMEVYLQVLPGESCILKLFPGMITGPPHKYVHPAGPAQKISGPWKVSFLSGGPELPDDTTVMETGSWTAWNVLLRKFSGTARYSVKIKKPDTEADGWILDLGRVAESARVRLNGREVAVLTGPNFYLQIPDPEWEEDNLLDIDVSNLMANRIADLDRRTVGNWRKYRLQGRTKETRGADGFTAADWEPRESGLIGPVRITPVKYMSFQEQ
jgi:hypothetical protein